MGRPKGKKKRQPEPQLAFSKTPFPTPHFSLQDEARFTKDHHSFAFVASPRLRDNAVQFVSAGMLQGTIQEAEEKMSTMTLQSSDSHKDDDNTGEEEDEIVFKGRQPAATESSSTPAIPSRSKQPTAALSTSTTTPTPTPAVASSLSPAPTMPLLSVQPSEVESDRDSVVSDVFRDRRGGKEHWDTGTTPWQSRSIPGIGWMPYDPRSQRFPSRRLHSDSEQSDAAVRDYLDNILANQGSDHTEDDGNADNQAIPSAFASRPLHLASPGDWQPQPKKSVDRNSPADLPVSISGDERLARMLAKHEELGLASDDLVDDDDNDDADDDDNDDYDMFDDNAGTPPRSTKSRNKHSFPSASLMADILDADPYNGFDVMDYDRPSLRAKNKGRRTVGPPELSDSDLNDSLQASYQTNRATKRLKKAEREELRKNGTLGRKEKSLPDLAIKYKNGFTIPEIVEEIRRFLASDAPSCALPPMEKYHRVIFHKVAENFKLGSRSRGSGKGRFIILSKTTRTIAFSQATFDEITQRKGFPYRPAKYRESGGKARPVVSYRDGEQVGATAPELGPENRGHAMLKKMGWTKGTALGALDNKGILEPIAHTVKTTKAGLQ